MPRGAMVGAALAGVTALLGWFAIGTELDWSLATSLSKGRGLAESLFLFFRFFTILTNVGIATLMSVSAVRLLLGRPLPPARLFNAGLVYILVTCLTYEAMLRSRWHPRGLQFFTDATIHDVVPALALVFWLVFAPRNGARWRDALWGLAYPAAYFVMTLAAGALGEGYPYDFLDVDRIGLPRVLVVAAVFLTVFYVLGIVTTALSKSFAARERL